MKKGETMSEEVREKIRLSKKGKSNGRLGYSHTEDTRKRMSVAQKGRPTNSSGSKGTKRSDETKLKMSETLKEAYSTGARVHPRLGKTVSEESRKKMRESRLGYYVSEETRRKLSGLRKGEKSHFWKGGVSQENRTERMNFMGTFNYKLWRKRIFERDNYTCQICKQVGGTLNADHIKPYSLFPELRLEMDNGRTLCAPCHRKTDTYGTRSRNLTPKSLVTT